uniref:Cytochrome c oxidase subunit 3 n=1 Tax=Spathius agrili TaxID=314331 RepID=D8KZU0_SPAAG|nr:cytochrome c oxidase subunit III [Spathius agrili]ACJ06259.1 cytochrome c oxidase subunit III [Spathius agrili]
MNLFYHPYHLVTLSPWPLLCSLSFINLMMGVVKWLYTHDNLLMFNGYLLLVIMLFQWWRDVIRESTYQGNHTSEVISGLRLGMVLFILSEVMFFLSFFWTYFHMFLSPSVEFGGVWPPKELIVFNPYNIPLLNTLILLSSGVFITWCHYSILSGNYDSSIYSILMTIGLGYLFVFFQYIEYNESYFSMSDSVYGSIFFLVTGFHGLHVIIGALFIFICWKRLSLKHYSFTHHFGFEASSWYWHFVDVVWLFLYIFIYWLSY